MVSGAGSKEVEKEVGEGAGQTPAAPPPISPGSREQAGLWSPQGTFESKTVIAGRNSIAHPTPSFDGGENTRLEEVQQRAQGHTAGQGRERMRKVHL